MGIGSPISVVEPDLSMAWLRTLSAVRASPGGTKFHVVTRVEDSKLEDARIRSVADGLLGDLGLDSIETVANTIFPLRMAETSSSPEILVARYRDVLPHLRRLHKNNQRGTYFGRIVSYDGTKGPLDQLTSLIDKLRKEQGHRGPKTARYEVDMVNPDSPANLRHDAGQAGLTVGVPVYRPGRDNAIMGFPCLSFCSFQLDGPSLHLVAHYRSQRLMQRAYGNYLGLARLQGYVAAQSGLDAGSLMIIAGRTDADIARYRLDSMIKSLEPEADQPAGATPLLR